MDSRHRQANIPTKFTVLHHFENSIFFIIIILLIFFFCGFFLRLLRRRLSKLEKAMERDLILRKNVYRKIKTFFQFCVESNNCPGKIENKERKRNQTELTRIFVFFSSLFAAIVFSRPQLISYTSFTGATTQCYNSMVANRNTQLFCAMLRSTSSRAVECVCRCARVCVYIYVSVGSTAVSIVVLLGAKSNTAPIEYAWATCEGEIWSFD